MLGYVRHENRIVGENEDNYSITLITHAPIVLRENEGRQSKWHIERETACIGGEMKPH